MRILLTLTFILICHIGFSQKTLTLIIDTIDFVDDFDKYNFNISITNQGYLDLEELDSTAIISTDNYPNFQTSITLKNDSSLIRIPIDQESGYLELSNVIENDTIRINYLKQYSNCYKDSSKTRIEYYRVKNNSVSDKPYKVKFKVDTEKNKCIRKPPFKTMLTINNQKYYVNIQESKSEAIEYKYGHGYKPRQTEKNHENYTGRRLYISSMTVRYINMITLKIK